MARRPSKHTRPFRPLDSARGVAADRSGTQFVVRTVTGSSAVKAYRCPGCQQPIPPATPHVVVWPVEPGLQHSSGLEERRHWHTGCWNRLR